MNIKPILALFLATFVLPMQIPTFPLAALVIAAALASSARAEDAAAAKIKATDEKIAQADADATEAAKKAKVAVRETAIQRLALWKKQRMAANDLDGAVACKKRSDALAGEIEAIKKGDVAAKEQLKEVKDAIDLRNPEVVKKLMVGKWKRSDIPGTTVFFEDGAFLGQSGGEGTWLVKQGAHVEWRAKGHVVDVEMTGRDSAHAVTSAGYKFDYTRSQEAPALPAQAIPEGVAWLEGDWILESQGRGRFKVHFDGAGHLNFGHWKNPEVIRQEKTVSFSTYKRPFSIINTDLLVGHGAGIEQFTRVKPAAEVKKDAVAPVPPTSVPATRHDDEKEVKVGQPIFKLDKQ